MSLPPAKILYLDHIYDKLQSACLQFSRDRRLFYTSIVDLLDPQVAKLRENHDERVALGNMYIRSQNSFTIEFKELPETFESRRSVWMTGLGRTIAMWQITQEQNYPKSPSITLSVQNVPHVDTSWISKLPDRFIHTLEFSGVTSIDYKQIPWDKFEELRLRSPEFSKLEQERIRAYLKLTHRHLKYTIT